MKLIKIILLIFCIITSLNGCTKKKHTKNYKNIVLITIDTLRADHLKSYQYSLTTSPFIDSIAEKSALFENCFVPLPQTKPSHTSLFTSKYPLEHMVLNNMGILDDSFITIADKLKENGYFTAGFPAVKFKYTNLAKGFEYFQDPKPNDKGILTFGSKKELFYKGGKVHTSSIISWLDKNKNKNDLFLWIHYFDVHERHNTPKQHKKEFKSNNYSNYIALNNALPKACGSKNQLVSDLRNYDSSITYTDNNIENLYSYFTKNNLNKNTLWIITSDHGEGLGQHNFIGHSYQIYNEQLKVPLIFHSTDMSIQNKRISTIVENLDVTPTILDLVGINYSNLNLSGHSLIKNINEEIDTKDARYAFSQKALKEKSDERYCIQNNEYKYVIRKNGTDEFFDLRTDPYELNNISASDPKEKITMRRKLAEKIGELKSKNY